MKWRKTLCSFYPLYPPAPGACLDTSLNAALAMPVTPDVLLLPSNLAPFAKLVPVDGGGGEHAAKVRNTSFNRFQVGTSAGRSGGM